MEGKTDKLIDWQIDRHVESQIDSQEIDIEIDRYLAKITDI